MKATVIWNVDHDQAAIRFDGSYVPKEPPSEAINHILEVMYNVNREEGKGLQFYMYEVWDMETDSNLIGLLFAESFDCGDDEPFDKIVTSLYQKILDSDTAVQQSGRYERKVFNA